MVAAASAGHLKPLPQRRGLGLIRVSKERDGMTSPEMQQTAIQQYADAQGIRIVDWVEGIDESGSDRKSAWWPRLDQSIARMEAREIDVIVVWRFSRVGRQRLRWAIALDRVDTLGGMILSANEPIESATASGRFARGMLGEINAYQSELIGEQWRETHDRRRRAGLPHGGHQRFGYSRSFHASGCSSSCERAKPHGEFTPDPVTGPILAEIYRRAIRGEGSGRITRWLNEAGILTTQGNPWINTNLYQMLDGGFGAGLVVHRPGWKNTRLPKSEWTFYPGAHDAVIDADEWAAYWQRRLTLSDPSRSIEARHLLTSLLYCGDCGGRMNYSHHRYVCVQAARSKGLSRTVVTITAESTERALEQWVMGLANDADSLFAAKAATQKRRVRSVNDAEAIQRKVARIDERMAALTIQQLDGVGIPDAAYQATIRRLDAERSSLTSRQKAVELVNAQREVDVRKVARTLAAFWPRLETHDRRQGLLKLVSGVIVRPGPISDRLIIIPKWDERA